MSAVPQMLLCLLLAQNDAGNLLGLPALSAQRPAASSVVSLGKALFFDSRLSVGGKISCASCHVPDRVFTDGQPRSVGHQGQLATRNAPSLLNVAYASSLFWDGRVADLESQALMPLLSPTEHGLQNGQTLVGLLQRDVAYVQAFREAFRVGPESISVQLVGEALAAYERTLLSAGSAFDRFWYGEDRSAMTVDAIRGFELFRGRAQCVSCHPITENGTLLSDGQFHMTPIGLPRTVTQELAASALRVAALVRQRDRKELERLISTNPQIAALGRYLVTLNPGDIGRFKTPSLRNVALTAPYMHDGSVKTLERTVDLELYSRADALRYPIVLTVSERRQLVEFLQSLTSRPFLILDAHETATMGPCSSRASRSRSPRIRVVPPGNSPFLSRHDDRPAASDD